MLLRHRPAPPLDAFVDCLWWSERDALPHRRELGLPTGRVDLVVPLRQAGVLRHESPDASTPPRRVNGPVVQGAHDTAHMRGLDGPSATLGVHFHPGGAAPFFGGGLPALRNRTESLADLWGPSVRDWPDRLRALPDPSARFALVERWLLERLLSARPAVPPADAALVGAVLARLQADPAAASIGPLQRATGWSPARFIRRFEAMTGLTPKRCARVLRLQALLPRIASAGSPDWAELAAEGGYADQSHLVHEFRALTGLTPGGYRPLSAGQPTHVPVVAGGARGPVEKTDKTRARRAR